jgi:hypothetical protein
MNLHHLKGEAMPDVSTANATLLALETVYISVIVFGYSPGQLPCPSIRASDATGFGLAVRHTVRYRNLPDSYT